MSDQNDPYVDPYSSTFDEETKHWPKQQYKSKEKHNFRYNLHKLLEALQNYNKCQDEVESRSRNNARMLEEYETHLDNQTVKEGCCLQQPEKKIIKDTLETIR